MTSTATVFLAHAKINLGLRVLRRRPDGFHDIETVFFRIDLADRISFAPAAAVSVACDSTDVGPPGQNLCVKAALLLRRELNLSAGVAITLRKRIPVGAGLGGGSSDAATVLRELPAFWSAAVPEPVLRRLALALGSDVPFFLGEGAAFARGRGELLEYFPLSLPYAVLVCYPNVHVSTSWAYGHAAFSDRGNAPDLRCVLLDGLNDPPALRAHLTNDFERAVIAAHPVIGEVKRFMAEAGAEIALMSGSGSSVFGLFADRAVAEGASTGLSARGFATSVTPPHFQVSARGTG